MYLAGTPTCCGVDELAEVRKLLLNGRTESQFRKALLNDVDYIPTPYIFWTVLEEHLAHSDWLRKHIKEHKLGSVRVIDSRGRINFNTDNRIFMYVWKVNLRKLNIYLGNDREEEYDI